MRNTIDKVLIKLANIYEIPVLITEIKTGWSKYYLYKNDAIKDEINKNKWVVCSYIFDDLYTGRKVIHLFVEEFCSE